MPLPLPDNPIGPKVSRRHLAQLLVLALAGAGVAQILRKSTPVGRDLGSSETAQAVMNDTTSPSQDVAQPTLTLVIFTDYRCPACKLANTDMERALEQDQHVRVVYKDWPIFGPVSERAARVAIASDRQGIYPMVHAQLMRDRRALDNNILREAIELSGGNWTQIEADLQKYASDVEDQLDRTRREAFQLSLSGTPSYLAGSILVTGAQDVAGFKRLFAAARETLKG